MCMHGAYLICEGLEGNPASSTGIVGAGGSGGFWGFYWLRDLGHDCEVGAMVQKVGARSVSKRSRLLKAEKRALARLSIVTGA